LFSLYASPGDDLVLVVYLSGLSGLSGLYGFSGFSGFSGFIRLAALDIFRKIR